MVEQANGLSDRIVAMETAMAELANGQSERFGALEALARDIASTVSEKIAPEPAAALTAERAFELAYGRFMSEKDREWLARVGLRAGSSDLGRLRSVIAAFDRQTHPTTITIRFDAEQLVPVAFPGFDLITDFDDLAVSRPLIGGTNYEGHLRRLVETVFRPGMTAVDIGANIGLYTMLFATLVKEEGKVFAFEPNSENCRLILLSAAKNRFPQVHLFPVALAASAGAALFSPAIGSNGGLMANGGEMLMHPNCNVVPCLRLDQLVDERVDFIKIDVEGAEHRALVGATKLIETWRPIITTEFSVEMLARVSRISGRDFINWMIQFDYRPFLVARDKPELLAIVDVDDFLADWGDVQRIEDLAFWPRDAALPSNLQTTEPRATRRAKDQRGSIEQENAEPTPSDRANEEFE
jgi:FkbM family methyltransferase